MKLSLFTTIGLTSLTLALPIPNPQISAADGQKAIQVAGQAIGDKVGQGLMIMCLSLFNS